MHEDYKKQIEKIQRDTAEALKKLRNRKREGLTHTQVQMLQKRLKMLYVELQDTKFKAAQVERVFRKRALTARA